MEAESADESSSSSGDTDISSEPNVNVNQILYLWKMGEIVYLLRIGQRRQ